MTDKQEPVGWMDDFGNVFPLAAHSTDGKPLSWAHAHKRRWKPLYLAAPPAQPADIPYAVWRAGWGAIAEWKAANGPLEAAKDKS